MARFTLKAMAVMAVLAGGAIADVVDSGAPGGLDRPGKPPGGKPPGGKPPGDKPEEGDYKPHDGDYDNKPHDDKPHDDKPDHGKPEHDDKPDEKPASPWTPLPTEKPDCKAKWEEYECDDDRGGKYTTKVEVYSKGCPLYKEHPEPTPLAPWAPWPTDKPKPKGNWKPKDKDYGYDDKDDYYHDGKYDDKDDYHHGKYDDKDDYHHGKYDDKDDKDDYYHGKPPHPEWDEKKGPKPATWDDWKKATKTWGEYEPKPTWEVAHGEYAKGWFEWDWKKGSKPAHWDSWKYKKVVIVTLVEKYKTPCETGWKDEEVTIYTTHCGCKETEVPKHPEYTTYTTECPESWGVGKTVTVTKPVDAEYTTWAEADKKPYVDEKKPYADEKTPVYNAEAEKTTWAEASVKTPAAASTWATYAKPAAETGKEYQGVAAWKGAAPATGVNKVMIGAAGAIAGLAMLL